MDSIWLYYPLTKQTLEQTMQTVNLNGRILKVKPNLTAKQQKLVEELQKLANNQNKKLN